MTNLIRLALLALGGLAALAFAGSAFASFSPRLVVGQESYRPTAASSVDILVATSRSDDPTAKITIYVPAGYTETLNQAAGTRIGSVDAAVIALDLGGANGKPLPLTGPVVVDSPANHTGDQCAPGLHQAVWILQAKLAGQTIPIPVYVDHTVGPEQAIGSAKLQVCFAPPDLPPGTAGRAPFGAKLVTAIFSVAGVFQNPGVRGMYSWRSLFTPFTPATGRPNVAGTLEADGVVPLPYQLTFGRLTARNGGVRLIGRLIMASTPVAKAIISIWAGTSKQLAAGTETVFGSARTNKAGRFALTKRLKATRLMYAERGPAPTGCATPSLGVSCVAALISPIDSATVRVPPPKKRSR